MPLLHSHYSSFVATMHDSATVHRFGTLILSGSLIGYLPSHRSDSFPSSAPAPEISSRHLYAGRRQARTQLWARLIPGQRRDPGFDANCNYRHFFDGSLAFVSTSHTLHGYPCLFPGRSPQSLFTNAAPGGLVSPPNRRHRGAYPHHWYSMTQPLPATVSSWHTDDDLDLPAPRTARRSRWGRLRIDPEAAQLNTRLSLCIQVIDWWRSAGVLSIQFSPVGLRPLPRLAGVTLTRNLLLGWCGNPTNTP